MPKNKTPDYQLKASETYRTEQKRKGLKPYFRHVKEEWKKPLDDKLAELKEEEKAE